MYKYSPPRIQPGTKLDLIVDFVMNLHKIDYYTEVRGEMKVAEVFVLYVAVA